MSAVQYDTSTAFAREGTIYSRTNDNKVSPLLYVKVDSGCSRFLAQNWRIPLQNGNLFLRLKVLNSKINLSLPIELIESSGLIIYSNSWIVCLFISRLGPSRPLVGLRPPSNSFIPPHYHSTSLPAAVQNTTPEGVHSSCGCSLTLTLTTVIGIWHSAGATKGVTSPAAHRGIWHGAVATKSWLHLPSCKSFVGIKKILNWTEIVYPDEKRNAQRWQSTMNWRHKKFIMVRKKVWLNEILIPCFKIVPFLLNFFDFSSTVFGISLFLSFLVRTLTLVAINS